MIRGILPILQLILLTMKLAGTLPVVDWSWGWVLFPLWIMLGSFAILAVWLIVFTKGTRP